MATGGGKEGRLGRRRPTGDLQGDGGSVQEVGRTWGKVGRGNLLPQPRVPLTLVEPHNPVRTVHPVHTGSTEKKSLIFKEGGGWMRVNPYPFPR